MLNNASNMSALFNKNHGEDLEVTVFQGEVKGGKEKPSGIKLLICTVTT